MKDAKKPDTPQDLLHKFAVLNPGQCLIAIEVNGQIQVTCHYRTPQDALLMKFVLDKSLNDSISNNFTKEQSNERR
jgi:hypothetical protein